MTKKTNDQDAKTDPVIVKDKDKPEQTDPVAESKESGTASTDDGREVALSPGAVPEGAPDVSVEDGLNVDAALSVDEMKELRGELTAGERGWLPLDADGYIIGAAKRGLPPAEPDVWYADVIVNANWPEQGYFMTTPAGAPITRKMNPSSRQPDEHNKRFEEAAEEQAAENKKR